MHQSLFVPPPLPWGNGLETKTRLDETTRPVKNHQRRRRGAIVWPLISLENFAAGTDVFRRAISLVAPTAEVNISHSARAPKRRDPFGLVETTFG